MRVIKKTLVLAALVLSGFSFVLAQSDPFMPLNPSTLGRGGSFTADAHGYNAFFYNPAGFASKGEFTLLSANAWAVMDSGIFDMLRRVIFGGEAFDTSLLGMGAHGTSSRDLTALTTTFTEVGNYFSDAYTQDPAAFSAIVAGMLADPAYSGAFIPGADPSTITSAADALALIDLATVAANPSLLTTMVDSIVTQVQADPTSFPTMPVAPVTTNLTADLQDAIAQAASSLPSGNLDVGAMVGIGWVGDGIGLGLFAQAQGVLRTPDTVAGREGTLFDARGRVLTSITLAGGFGFELFDGVTLGIGIRPTLIGFGEISPMALLSLASGTSSGSIGEIFDTLMPAGYYKSFYLGLDAGLLIDLGAIDIGVAVKDIVPWKLRYYNYDTMDEFIASLPLQFGEANLSTDTEGLYYIQPLKINAGIQWNLDLGDIKKLIDIKLGADIFDVFDFVRYLTGSGVDSASLSNAYVIWDHIGAGVDIKLLDFITLQVGYYKQAITGGIGLDLVFLEINIAAMARDLNYNGTEFTFSETGLSIELAFRF